MDTRKLRNISAAGFGARKANVKSLAAALDDGFTDVERDSVVGIEMILVAWEVKPGIGGYESSTVWALADYGDGNARPVKFNDGGRSPYGSITGTLKSLRESGISTDVAVVMDRVTYWFVNGEGDEQEGKRYTFRDPSAAPAEDADSFRATEWTPTPDTDEPGF